MNIFAINLGSTSTKIAYYEDETCRLKQTIAHSLEDLQHADGIFAQYGFRRRDIENFLAQHGIAVSELDAIVSRGGPTAPVEGGTYRIDEDMLSEIRTGKYGIHPCSLGCQIAYDMTAGTKAAALTVDILKIRGRVAAGLWGAIMAAFPCLGYTFLYMFTASAYALAILLAAGSVWLARRGDRWSLAGPVLLALAMGIYQAYVTVAIGLALLAVLRETLEPSATFPKTLRLGVQFVALLAVGAVLYYAVLMVFLKVKGLELLSYLGMDAASSGGTERPAQPRGSM